MKNYYNILEVSENASYEVIDKAYKVLVKKYHPDLNANSKKAEAKMREINEAYNVLSDGFIREQYDVELRRERRLRNQNNYQESDYGRMYRDQQRQKYEKRSDREGKSFNQYESDENNNTNQNGIESLLIDIIKNRPRMKDLKSIKKLDLGAAGLTILVILILGVILYFLPFTHDWMYKNFINTPLTSWMFK